MHIAACWFSSAEQGHSHKQEKQSGVLKAWAQQFRHSCTNKAALLVPAWLTNSISLIGPIFRERKKCWCLVRSSARSGRHTLYWHKVPVAFGAYYQILGDSFLEALWCSTSCRWSNLTLRLELESLSIDHKEGTFIIIPPPSLTPYTLGCVWCACKQNLLTCLMCHDMLGKAKVQTGRGHHRSNHIMNTLWISLKVVVEKRQKKTSQTQI